MKGLQDIKNDRELLEKVNWDMKPRPKVQRAVNETEEQMGDISKSLQAREGVYFYIEVIHGQAVVFLYQNYPDGSGKYLAEITDIPREMLDDAVNQAGGSGQQHGKYPLNEEVKNWLKKELSV